MSLLGTGIFQVFESRLWRVARSLRQGAPLWGNGEDRAQLLSLACSWGGLADGKFVARAGCSRRANNTSGEKVRWAAARAAPVTGCHPSPSAARASRKVLGCLGGELVLQPPPPSAGFQGRRWQPTVSGSPHRGVEQCDTPQHQLLLSRPCTASSTSPHRALLPRPSRTWQPPGRPSCRPATANVPAERVFLAEKLLSSLWKQ